MKNHNLFLEGELKLGGTINEIIDLAGSMNLPLPSNDKHMINEEEKKLILEINEILGD